MSALPLATSASRNAPEGISARLVEEHTDRVWRTLRYLGVKESELDDAVQEVFLVVHRRSGEFRGDAKWTTWLYEICVRVALAQRRQFARRKEDLVEEPTAGQTCLPRVDEVLHARNLLCAALKQLPDEQRQVLVLHEIEEVPMGTVASVLNCPVFTAYSRLRLARARLKQVLISITKESTP